MHAMQSNVGPLELLHGAAVAVLEARETRALLLNSVKPSQEQVPCTSGTALLYLKYKLRYARPATHADCTYYSFKASIHVLSSLYCRSDILRSSNGHDMQQTIAFVEPSATQITT